MIQQPTLTEQKGLVLVDSDRKGGMLCVCDKWLALKFCMDTCLVWSWVPTRPTRGFFSSTASKATIVGSDKSLMIFCCCESGFVKSLAHLINNSFAWSTCPSTSILDAKNHFRKGANLWKDLCEDFPNPDPKTHLVFCCRPVGLRWNRVQDTSSTEQTYILAVYIYIDVYMIVLMDKSCTAPVDTVNIQVVPWTTLL